MSDVEAMETEIPEEGDKSLYEEIVSLTGIEYSDSEFKNPDAWKESVARHFNEKYDPDDAVAEEEFSKLSKAIQDWVTDVTMAINDNKKKKSKDRERLPTVSGFPITEDVVKEKPRRGRPPKSAGDSSKSIKSKPEKASKEKKIKSASVKIAKVKKTPRDRNAHRPSRYERVMRFMKDNPDVVDPSVIAKASDVAAASIGYCMEAARAAFTVYQPEHPSLSASAVTASREKSKKESQEEIPVVGQPISVDGDLGSFEEPLEEVEDEEDRHLMDEDENDENDGDDEDNETV
jgi:hypothetical protein